MQIPEKKINALFHTEQASSSVFSLPEDGETFIFSDCKEEFENIEKEAKPKLNNKYLGKFDGEWVWEKTDKPQWRLGLSQNRKPKVSALTETLIYYMNKCSYIYIRWKI